MKGRFSSIDIAVITHELKRFIGMRVVNVYDIDNKTYLIRLGKPDEKSVILLESGIRLHSTDFDWPKNPAPSGFSMKLRKHLKGRRLENISQLGIDRIVDLQFGSSEAAYHVILELYDRGNMILTDHEFTILTLLRTREDSSQDVKFAVREIYPMNIGRQHVPCEFFFPFFFSRIKELMLSGKDGDVLKKILLPNVDFGPAIIDHVLLGAGFSENVKIGKNFSLENDLDKLMDALHEAENLLVDFTTKPCKGYIVQKKDKKPNPAPGEEVDILLYEEFHPYLFHQHEKKPFIEFDQFDKAVDEFFSKLESQRVEVKVLQQEKSAMKKLEHVKKDHEKRLEGLQKEQETDFLKGQLIENNLHLVDQAILIVRSALANQIDWSEIWNVVKEAQANGDAVASTIKALRLDSNQITLLLQNPYVATETEKQKPMRVDIDLSLSAYGNSRKYFDKKRQAAKKEQKTMEASSKAFKSAEKKTKQTLKDVATAASISKTRKTYWFEKFLWFISSENYLVIGGRDQQQNELIVKRYMNSGDLYVHADLHGASSCVIKNPRGGPVPPKTLNEAGTMAICNSAAWESKVVTSAWWVYPHQVSKTAPSGEYLTTGSFMIRGKKNYLPPSYLIYGFGFLFKLEEGSVERHKGERKLRTAAEDVMERQDEDTFLVISDSSDDENKDSREKKTVAELPASSEAKTSEAHPAPEDETSQKLKRLGSQGDSQALNALGSQGDSQAVNVLVSLEEVEYPDTNIQLEHIKGDKYELHKETKASAEKEDLFYLGDNVPVVLGEKVSRKVKVSAKQRRDMKRERKPEEGDKTEDSRSADKVKDETSPATLDGKDKEKQLLTNDEDKPSVVVQPLKRGQRSKQKKIKDKYADQDEEERRLRMEILASAGTTKADQSKKGKKAKNKSTANSKSETQVKTGSKAEALAKANPAKMDSVSENVQHLVESQQEETSSSDNIVIPEPQQHGDSDDEKEEELSAQDESIIDSLTGIPHVEDELLYAIPVCAPYNALINYKFKVKLLPGSTKKGKAVKSALNMFAQDKAITSREKTLLKVLKDVDVARNLPGKVKVAAPNLHKIKK
ncbi:unnamed protein product [Lymnaea stagnalis]|uniref:Nuclear export mediator factor NEMF n=1 Tax=Lymnaea stagnalis TaxID=6523 RepID=A0AAV2HI38_LYMST